MTFMKYVRVKKWFIAFFIILMLLVTLFMYTSTESGKDAGGIIYLNIICFFGVLFYLVIGYYYRRTFYRNLEGISLNSMDELTVLLPKPQDPAQAVTMDLFRHIQRVQSSQIRELLQGKKDHQEFVMSWIHEVKLPITAARLLMENSAGQIVDDLTDKLEDEIDKIDHYVEQALNYSRIDSFNRDYFITEVSLEPVVKASLKKYAKLFITKMIHFQLDGNMPLVHSDSKWLSYIVDQVVANSLKYTGEKGEITFSYEEDSREKRLMISDTGIGIKPEDVPRVFDKGFTGSAGRTGAKSTGMGLYLANQMAGKLGHKLSIRSVYGKLTEVTVHFLKFSDLENIEGIE